MTRTTKNKTPAVTLTKEILSELEELTGEKQGKSKLGDYIKVLVEATTEFDEAQLVSMSDEAYNYSVAAANAISADEKIPGVEEFEGEDTADEQPSNMDILLTLKVDDIVTASFDTDDLSGRVAEITYNGRGKGKTVASLVIDHEGAEEEIAGADLVDPSFSIVKVVEDEEVEEPKEKVSRTKGRRGARSPKESEPVTEPEQEPEYVDVAFKDVTEGMILRVELPTDDGKCLTAEGPVTNVTTSGRRKVPSSFMVGDLECRLDDVTEDDKYMMQVVPTADEEAPKDKPQTSRRSVATGRTAKKAKQPKSEGARAGRGVAKDSAAYQAVKLIVDNNDLSSDDAYQAVIDAGIDIKESTFKTLHSSTQRVLTILSESDRLK